MATTPQLCEEFWVVKKFEIMQPRGVVEGRWSGGNLPSYSRHALNSWILYNSWLKGCSAVWSQLFCSLYCCLQVGVFVATVVSYNINNSFIFVKRKLFYACRWMQVRDRNRTEEKKNRRGANAQITQHHFHIFTNHEGQFTVSGFFIILLVRP